MISDMNRSASWKNRRRGAGLRGATIVVGSCGGRPVPGPACAGGEWDMCRNGSATLRRDQGTHGSGRALSAFPRRGGQGRQCARCACDPARTDERRRQAWDHIERIGRAPRHGRHAACYHRRRGRSACSPRCSASSTASTCMCSIDRVMNEAKLVRALGETSTLGMSPMCSSA